MELSEMLFPECILTHVQADSKEDALHQLFQALLKMGKVKPSFYEAVLERERDYPTGLELGQWNAAIPHVVPAHVEHSALGIAVMEKPVTFQCMDDDNATVDVKVIFNIALDKDGKQLDILQELIGIVSDPELMGRLAGADTPEDVLKILQERRIQV